MRYSTRIAISASESTWDRVIYIYKWYSCCWYLRMFRAASLSSLYFISYFILYFILFRILFFFIFYFVLYSIFCMIWTVNSYFFSINSLLFCYFDNFISHNLNNQFSFISVIFLGNNYSFINIKLSQWMI